MGNITSKLCDIQTYIPKKNPKNHKTSDLQMKANKLMRRDGKHFNKQLINISTREWANKPGISTEDFNKLYKIEKFLGSGFYGSVFLAYLKKSCVKFDFSRGSSFKKMHTTGLRRKRTNIATKGGITISTNLEISDVMNPKSCKPPRSRVFEFREYNKSKTKQSRPSNKHSKQSQGSSASRASPNKAARGVRKQYFAIKNINKVNHSADLHLFLKEIELMKSIDHPNIINFYEVYEDSREFHIVMEYCDGGDLLSILNKKKRFSEAEAINYTYQVLRAIAYLHNKKIAHRDIKPENFLLKGNVVKMMDFGLSDSCRDRRLEAMAGSPYYISPEVLDGDYDELCDMWSLGVMLYQFITGEMPFEGSSHKEIFQKIFTYNVNYGTLRKAGMSNRGISLLKQLLVPDQYRIKAHEALRHPWFNRVNSSVEKAGLDALTKNMLKNLMRFNLSTCFQQEIIKLMLLLYTDAPELEILKDVFFAIDAKKFKGVIDKEQISKLYETVEMSVSELQIEDIIDNLYLFDKGQVTYLEFLGGLVDQSFFTRSSRLKMIFRYLDTDNSGLIDRIDIAKCFKRFGRSLGRDNIKRMIAECEPEIEGRVSFKEFKRVMEVKERDLWYFNMMCEIDEEMRKKESSMKRIPVSKKDRRYLSAQQAPGFNLIGSVKSH